MRSPLPFQHMSADLLAQIQSTIASNLAKAPVCYRLKSNPKGRDFVVGDIHGSFDLVRRAMRTANFDKSKDRLFACGDMVDRGVESPTVSRFLKAPFVHAVMGNHEWNLLQAYQNLSIEGDGEDELPIHALAHANWNGMGWLGTTSPDQRAAVLCAISQLPLAIEVETPRGLLGIIHGEVPIGMDWPAFRKGLEQRNSAIIESCLEGRSRFQNGTHELIRGIDRVFCGHSVQIEGARRLGNVFYIDTGAVFSQFSSTRKDYPAAALTMANMRFSTRSLSGQGTATFTRLAPIRVIHEDDASDSICDTATQVSSNAG